jgi:dienelactone hydrolase
MRAALVTLVLLASCGSSPPPKAEATPVAAPTTAAATTAAPARAGAPEVELAQTIVKELGATEFDKVLTHLTETSRAATTDAALREAWESMARDTGTFRGVEKIAATTGLGFTVVSLRCKTDRAAFEVRVLFNANATTTKDSELAATGVVVSHVWDPPTYADPSKFKEEGSTVGSGRSALPATLTTPLGAGPFPAVVLVPGTAPSDRDGTAGGTKIFRDIAWGLSSRGIAVLRYDKRTSLKGKELAKDDALTIKDEAIDDAADAVAQLEKNPAIDKKRVFVVGHGEGGRLAPKIAEDASAVAGVVMLAAPSRPLEDQVVLRATYLAKLDGTVSPEEKESLATVTKAAARAKSPRLARGAPAKDLPLGLPASYWLSLRKIDPVKSARKIKAPLLVLSADRDFEATPDDARRWKRALAGRPKLTTKSCATCNHLFVGGSGTSDPAEYGKPANVAAETIDELARFVTQPSP